MHRLVLHQTTEAGPYRLPGSGRRAPDRRDRRHVGRPRSGHVRRARRSARDPPRTGCAQAIPALVAGDIDFAIGQPMGPFRAALGGEEVRILSNYANSLASGDSDVNSVVQRAPRAASSWPTCRQDRFGQQPRRCRVTSPSAPRSKPTVETPSTINFVAVAFPNVRRSKAGTIDAAWAPDPFRRNRRRRRRHRPGWPLRGDHPRSHRADQLHPAEGHRRAA